MKSILWRGKITAGKQEILNNIGGFPMATFNFIFFLIPESKKFEGDFYFMLTSHANANLLINKQIFS